MPSHALSVVTCNGAVQHTHRLGAGRLRGSLQVDVDTELERKRHPRAAEGVWPAAAQLRLFVLDRVKHTSDQRGRVCKVRVGDRLPRLSNREAKIAQGRTPTSKRACCVHGQTKFGLTSCWGGGTEYARVVSRKFPTTRRANQKVRVRR